MARLLFMIDSSSPQRRRRVAILISGRGSNMEALIEAATASDYPAEIVLVMSNKPDAAGLARARAHGIETVGFTHKTFETREDFDAAMDGELKARAVEFVALAGFMRVLSPWFCQQWQGRMINIHPSLLPAFKGLDTHKRALEAGVKEHGCTVHYVTPDLDDGETILQARVTVLPQDDEASLASRVLTEEHSVYPKALAIAVAKLR
jgi:phosphoribosylglycinamide formyltransferase 1